MSNIVNDISVGINVIQGLVGLLQKGSVILHTALHPLYNTEVVNSAINQANQYCQDMHNKHVIDNKDKSDSEKTE